MSLLSIPRIIAHRGSPRAAPENTLASFRQAARDGAAWVEFDVALTADGRPVIFHDDNLDRTTDGAGQLNDLPFDLLRNLDAGSWFSRAFAGEAVPTLEEALDLFADLGLGFNMEIKPAIGREAETAQVALEVAKACWNGPLPLVSSFSLTAVAVAKDVQPAWPRGILYDRVAVDWADAAAKLEAVSIGADQKHLEQAAVAAIHAEGRKVTAYTVNDPARAETLFSWGVDAVFTDVPGMLLKYFP